MPSGFERAGFTATARAGQLSREAQGYGLVTEVYGLT